ETTYTYPNFDYEAIVPGTISGYDYDSADPSLEAGTLTGDKTIKLYYNPTPVVPDPTYYSATITYVYAGGGGTAAPTYSKTDLADGYSENVTSTTIAGYTADKTSVSVVISGADFSATVTYTANRIIIIPDPTPTPSPEPTPDPEPTPVIEEDEPEEVVVILEDDDTPPLAAAPVEDPAIILDDETPLAAVPKTGDADSIAALGILSAAAVVGAIALFRRRRDESAD
ncbi:MAG: LPXTG cell wall anchor domain-containing protein, partial [Oscillospiraceae bacterium]|nr:LPXTG cell wall anchor domain-containing protein [Oscillospiraceae bacterium]